jgi:GTPase SAR1 family protein
LFQVVIVGNGAVGKSSMIQRYCRGTFTKTYKKTIGTAATAFQIFPRPELEFLNNLWRPGTEKE